MPKILLIPLGLGGLTMGMAIGMNHVPLAIAGLGMLLVGLTLVVLIKLDQVHSTIRSSGDKVETVLKQRLH